MTISVKGSIIWNGETYYGADRIGFNEQGLFIVSLFSYPEPHGKMGNYFTTIPISEEKYRASEPTNASVIDARDALIVICDWGDKHSIKLPRQAIDALLAEAAEHGVPIAPNV